MNRRHFLEISFQTVAGAATVAGLAPRVFAAGQQERIPVGFLGASYSHAPGKLKLLVASPEWECVGVCDSSEAGQKNATEAGAKLISQEELLTRARVVVVESEPRDHAAHALLALQAGRHLHLEKPATLILADMQAIVALAREKKLLLQTGYMWRYHPGFQAIFDAVQSGWLGDVFLVRGYIGNNLPAARRPEWAEFAGGSMFELGSHLVDATVHLLGKPKTVTPFVRHLGKFDDTLRDNNVAVLEYEHATAVLMNSAMQAGASPARSFEVMGTKGTAMLTQIEPPALTIDLAKAAGPYKKGRQDVPMPAYQRFEADFVELAGAVRGERALCRTLDDELVVEETLLRASGM
jgi:predicted dehydrogenase